MKVADKFCRVFKRLIPIVTMQERIQIQGEAVLYRKSKNSFLCHTEGISLILALQASVNVEIIETAIHSENGDSDSDDEMDTYPTIFVALCEHICMNVPETADARNHVVEAVDHLLTSSPWSTVEVRETMLEFLCLYSQNKKSLFRLFAVQLVSKWLHRSEWYSTPRNLAQCLKVLLDRSQDKVSSVRAKALTGLSSVLCAGQSSDSSQTQSQSQCTQTQEYSQVETLTLCIRNYFATRMEDDDEEEPSTCSFSWEDLLDLFRCRLQDEKTVVRKAAIQALEVILCLNVNTDGISSADANALHARCGDTAVSVRQQAIQTLTSVLLRFPQQPELQKLWNMGVLPLTMDPEMTVQVSRWQGPTLGWWWLYLIF